MRVTYTKNGRRQGNEMMHGPRSEGGRMLNNKMRGGRNRER